MSLQPGSTYYYRLWGTDSGGNPVIGQILSFTTPVSPAQPTIYDPSLTVSSITNQSASITFSPIHPGTAITTVTFEYGTTAAYGSSTYGGAPFAPGTLKLSLGTLTGLLPDTLYHIRAKAENEHGTAFSQDFTFRTLPLPVPTTLPASNITDLGATFNGTVDFKGNGGISPQFAYKLTGTNPTYYNIENGLLISTDPETGVKTYAKSLTSLQPDTSYTVRIESLSGGYQGEEITFRTLPAGTRPVFNGDTFTAQISHDKATVDFGNVFAGSSNTTIALQFGTTTAYGDQISLDGIGLNQLGQTLGTLEGLSPGTTYHVRAKATNAQGTVYSQSRTITTYLAPSMILSAPQNVTDISALLNGSVNPQGRSLNIKFILDPDGGANPDVNSSLTSVQGNNATQLTFDALRMLKPNLTYRCKLTTWDGLNYYDSNVVAFTTGSASSLPFFLGAPALSNIGTTSAKVVLSSPNGGHLHPGASTATLVYEYGTSESFGNTVPYSFGQTFVPPSIGHASFVTNLTNLIPDTTFYLRPRATNAQGVAYGETVTFRTLPLLTPETLHADEITESTALLHGSIENTPERIVREFQYGLTTSYGSTISVSSSTGGPDGARKEVEANPRFLVPGTTYHYRLRVQYFGIGSTFYGEDRTFTTLQRPPSPPVFPNGISGNVLGSDSVRISAYCDSGTSATDITLEYGTTGTLENILPFATDIAPNTKTSLQNIVTGLMPGTTYFFRLTATNAEGTTISNVISYTTRELPVPFGITSYDVTQTTAKFVGSIQSQAGAQTVDFEWGPDTEYGNTVRAYRSGNSYTASISGLLPERTYHYRMIIGTAPDIIYTEDRTFTTPAVPGPPFVAEILTSYGITAAAATVWIEKVAAPSSITFEYGTTTALGQAVTLPLAPADEAFYTDLATDLTDLLPDTLYHFRCIASNNQGVTASPTSTFRTLPLPILTSAQATEIAGDSATFRGEVNPNRNLLSTSFQYGLTPEYGSRMQSAQPLLNGIHATGVSAEIPSLEPETTYHYRLVAVDEKGRTYVGPSETVTTLSMIEDWRRTNFGFEVNSGIAADLAAPFGDSTPNLVKYALGISSRQHVPDMLHENLIEGKKHIGLSFTRDPRKHGLTFTVQANNTLTGVWETIATSNNGAPTTGTGVISETPGTGSEITVNVSDSAEISSNTKRFLRLKITRSE